MWDFIDKIPRDSLDGWFRWLTIAAIGLPVVGAIMGGMCGWGAFLVSSQIGNLQAIDLKEAKQSAADAQTALKQFKAPRSLSSQQQSAIVDAIKPFVGQGFAGQVAASVPDAWSLWVLLDRTLRTGNWIRVPPWGLATGDPPAGVPVSPNEGVTIFVLT